MCCSRLQIEKFYINITEYLHRYKWILDANLKWKTKEVGHIQGNPKSINIDSSGKNHSKYR